jgi:hypothetical protein
VTSAIQGGSETSISWHGAETVELKAGQLLRPKHRPVVGWLLSPASPLSQNAQVHLTDTAFFVLARLVDLLIGQEKVRATTSPGHDPRSREMAVTLYEEGPRTYGGDSGSSSSRWPLM